MITQANQKIEKSEEIDGTKEAGALKTDEILSILSKTSYDFQRESEISSKVSTLFNRKTLKEIAEDAVLKKKIEKPELPRKEEKNIEESSEEESQTEEIKQKQEKNIEEKKYTEIEAKKMANEYAKLYYNRGYNLGIKKIKEELAKGDKALAIILKNTTDSLFTAGPEFAKKINESLNASIYNTCKEIIGYEIDTKTDLFLKRIQQLSDSLMNSVKKAKIFLNKNDFESLKKFLDQNQIDINQELSIDKTLERGDLKIRSGSIEIDDVISSKIKLPIDGGLESEMVKLQQENKVLADKNKAEQTKKNST